MDDLPPWVETCSRSHGAKLRALKAGREEMARRMAPLTASVAQRHREARQRWFRALAPADKATYTRDEVIAIMRILAARFRRLPRS